MDGSVRSDDQQLTALRKRGARIVFLWGGALSALTYTLLGLLDRSPDLDRHISVTAWTMLLGYLALRAWLYERRRRPAASRTPR